ncbi:hypothetical protein AK830_g7777 [Neonectria ditissima]|uniref:Uncharacterized protein n=1 Tax=Neonectria ditissima TaxID=78410 RepID=A0A0P7AYX9_9HYPO|nr:hypothetical protein AK830_g7777 [Neonectria ditissima]
MYGISTLFGCYSAADDSLHHELFPLGLWDSPTMSTCTLSRWANATGSFTSDGHSLPTTLETITRSDEEWNSGKPMYPVPTGEKSSEDKLPNNPNFPWGGEDSPIHRHQNTTKLGDGTRDGDLLPRSKWRSRWDMALAKVKSIWQRPKSKDEGP